MNVVIKVNDEVKEKMIKYYKDKMRDKVIPYVVFQAQEEDTVITMYESGKVMFQGLSADVDASMWGYVIDNSEEEKSKDKVVDQKYYNCSSIGSDEVGTGDYFGPIVVTAAYVNKEDINFLEELGVGDSKKITDDKILKIAPELAKKLKYKSVILSNSEYNDKHSSDNNMNKIKAIMHNSALYQLVNFVDEKYDMIIVDEFAREARYYEYLRGVNPVQRGITFLTKAEDKNLAVAAASIISRFIFLKEFDKICDSVGLPLPKGAGKAVDKLGEELVEKFDKDKLREVAKLNFKNTERILHTMIY